MRFPHSPQSNVKPRFTLFGTFAVSLCLLTAFLFLGCPMGGSSGGGDGTPTVSVAGTWTAAAGDKYIITSTKLTYDSGYGAAYNYEGTIAEVVSFTSTAGIIVFKFTQTTTTETGNMGKFTAVYYKDLTANSVSLATANEGSPSYATPTAASLQAAKTKFTADKAGDYASIWGAYSK